MSDRRHQGGEVFEIRIRALADDHAPADYPLAARLEIAVADVRIPSDQRSRRDAAAAACDR